MCETDVEEVFKWSVNEGEGLSGVPALDSVGERSAKCTSALSPVSNQANHIA